MDRNSLEACLEALLFTHGEPIAMDKIATLLTSDQESVEEALANLERNLNQSNRGLMIIKKYDRIQLVTKPNLSQIAQKIIETEFKEDLTPAAVETLAILAYGGPLNKSEIEYVRGVNSFYILRNLYLRGLIEKDDKQYSLSFNCLKQLGLASLNDLPDYQQHQDLIKKFRDSYER